MDRRVSAPTRIILHALAALVGTALLVLPDHLYDLISGNNQLAYRPLTISLIFVIVFLLLALRNWLVIFTLLGLFFLLQVGELLHIAYFGTSFTPHEIFLLFTEFDEVFKSAAGDFALLIAPLLIAATCFAALVVLVRFTASYRLQLPAAWLPLLLLLLILPVQAYTSVRSQRFYPDPKTYSIENGYKAFSYFMGNELPGFLMGKQAKAWKEYSLENIGPPVKANIVVIMGESLTPAHMSLFGYERKTTPQLEKLRSEGLIYKQGIAAGVATKVSLPMFFNVQREPGGPRHILNQESNLFKMARQQGFRVHQYSVQSDVLGTYTGTEHVHHLKTEKHFAGRFEARHDEVLHDTLMEVDLNKPNFIVLHQRGSHSPYDRNYPKEFAVFGKAGSDPNQHRIDTYDNSVRYTDHFVYNVITYLKESSSLPVYVLFTSDHGEALGEKDGLYGHSMLTREAALVPFVFYAHRGEDRFLDIARAIESPTHYEMGRLLAGMLGYEVINPNYAPGIFYLNGTDLTGNAGFLVVDKTGRDWKLSKPRPDRDY